MEYVSRFGFVLAGVFILASAYLLLTQGLFGESFVALILGIPWVFVLSYFEFFNPQSVATLAALLLLPIALNAAILYGLGMLVEHFLGEHIEKFFGA